MWPKYDPLDNRPDFFSLEENQHQPPIFIFWFSKLSDLFSGKKAYETCHYL